MGIARGPVVASDVSLESYPKVAPHLERQMVQDELSQPKEAVGNFHSQVVTWCATKKDCDGKWSWHEDRAWSDEEWSNTIQPKFLDFAKKTWGEIVRMAYGKGAKRKKMHHGHDISDLVEEAQHRWKEVGLEEFDAVFRFRLGATKRAWGYIAQSHFFLVWWERSHQIYPVSDN